MNEATEAKLAWETQRFDRFNELVRNLGDIDDFEFSPKREHIETPGGSIPRRISGRTMKRLIGQLDREVPERGR